MSIPKSARESLQAVALAAARAHAFGARHARPLLLTAAALATFVLLALVAYQLALARVPQHRAALERFVHAQTGFEVRFATLQVGLGWHGPEAVFSHIELAEPAWPGARARAGESRTVVRAPRLTVAFDTWRILRHGQVQAARITLSDPEIDLAPLLASAARRRAVRAPGAAPEQPAQSPLLARARLLERLPLLRVDIEGGSLRVPPERSGAAPFALRISRASLRRNESATSASALVLLPADLGRSLFVSFRIEGPVRTLASTSGELRFTGRGLAFASWREILASQRWAPAAGSGDLSARIEWRDGRLQALRGEIDAQRIAWPQRDAETLRRLAQLRAAVSASRRGELLRVDIADLVLDDGKGPTGSAALQLEIAADGERIAGESASLPLGPALAFAQATGLVIALPARALDASGELQDVRFSWARRAGPGRRLEVSARLREVALALREQPASVSALGGELEMRDGELALRIGSERARLLLPALFARSPEAIAVQSELRWTHQTGGWTLSSERLQLEHPALAVTLSGALAAEHAGAPRLALHGRIERLDPESWRESFTPDARWPALAALSQALSAGVLDHGEFALSGTLDAHTLAADIAEFTGRLAAHDVALAAGASWPQASGLAGELSWSGGRARFGLGAGEVAGLGLAHAQGEWLLGSPRPLSLRMQLRGRLEQAREWLEGQDELRAQLGPIASLEAGGPAVFDLELAAPARPEAALRWSLATRLEGARLRFSESLPALESLQGRVTLDAGRLRVTELTGRWLGGPVSLRQLPAPARGRADQIFAAEGLAQPDAVLRAVGFDGDGAQGGSPERRLAWSAELRHEPGRTADGPGWHILFRSRLDGAGAGAGLPTALGWARDPRLPLEARLTLDERGRGRARFEAFDTLRALAALERREGRWQIERAALRLGGGTPTLPASARVTLQGEVEALDGTAAFALWRLLDAAGPLPPGIIDVAAEVLRLGELDYRAARLSGGFGEQGLRLVLAAREAAASIEWPRRASAERPLEMQFARLALPADGAVAIGAFGLLALAPATRLAIEDLQWGARRFGRLEASAAVDGEVVELRQIRLAHDSYSGSGSGSCRLAPQRCEWALQLDSRSAGDALRALGLGTELAAERGALALNLVWDAPEGAGQTGLRGRLEVRLDDGRIAPAAAAAPQASPPGLFAGTAALLRTVQDGRTFESLTGSFELASGVLRTEDLRIVAPAGELALHGRIDLERQSYEQQAIFTAATSRVQAALRRMGEEPSLAAAVSALRELMSAEGHEPQRVSFTLRGTYDAPLVERSVAK